MLTNQKHKIDARPMSFFACAPVVSNELVANAKKIAADETGNVFWLNLMRQRAEKTQGTRYAIASPLMRELEKAGRRLERDPGDNYALALVTSMILNDVYLAEQREDDRYKKYFPRNKKTGELINIRFTSEHFCQREREDYVPVYMTESGAVRAKIHTCGKAWTCPICAAKIAVRRNLEVHTILDKARSNGMTAIMITLTIPHDKNQPLLYLSELNQKAYLHLFNSDDIKELKKYYKWFGTIKTMETQMDGKSGWHNHFHVVLIFESVINKYDEKFILSTFKVQWEKSCTKYGILDANNINAVAKFCACSVNLKRDFDPSYIAKQSEEWKKEHQASEKWGVAEEVTLGKIKKGAGSNTAFGHVAQMARRAASGNYTVAEMGKDAEMFIEYACAMYGRSMIQFSKGLRKWAGLDEEKTDKDVCNEQKAHGDLLGGFDKEQHTFIRTHALWRPFKKLLISDIDVAIEAINEIFKANGLLPFYSRDDMKGYIFDGDCAFPEIEDYSAFPEFDEMELKEETPPQETVKCAHIGEVRHIEQLSLFVADCQEPSAL